MPTHEINTLNKITKSIPKALLQIKSSEAIKKTYSFLYPLQNPIDPDFNIKIAEKREFFDTINIVTKDENIEKQSNLLCNKKEFQLQPHQLFVRNFLSFKTPYNSLLLYHGVGTGKTCSSILVCEEMRTYMKYIKSQKKIFIIASPNVQDNFMLQMFDESKLKNINGLWNLQSCTGNIFLKEINPMNMKGLSKENIIREVKKIIKRYYHFMGYGEFSNYINKKINSIKNINTQIKQIKKLFSNNLIVIDEVHNIRDAPDNPKKKIAHNLLKITEKSNNLKLLLLSATPMYNSYEEIIWLLNLMNINDGRAPVIKKNIFNTDGTFVINNEGDSTGKDLLINKSIGYISYIRGENPYTFPYRIWPLYFSKHSLMHLKEKDPETFYPQKQINNEEIISPIQHLDLFIVTMDKPQEDIYNYIIEKLTSKFKKIKRGFGYELLEGIIQTLDITYPHPSFQDEPITTLYGKDGLDRIMKYEVINNERVNYQYKNDIKKTFGPIFSNENIGKYSAKIKHICDSILHSKGVVMIYSQYIQSGCLPIALALEEMGFTRYGRNSLFKKPPHPPH